MNKSLFYGGFTALLLLGAAQFTTAQKQPPDNIPPDVLKMQQELLKKFQDPAYRKQLEEQIKKQTEAYKNQLEQMNTPKYQWRLREFYENMDVTVPPAIPPDYMDIWQEKLGHLFPAQDTEGLFPVFAFPVPGTNDPMPPNNGDEPDIFDPKVTPQILADMLRAYPSAKQREGIRTTLIEKSDKLGTFPCPKDRGGTPFQTGVFNPRSGEYAKFKRFLYDCSRLRQSVGRNESFCGSRREIADGVSARRNSAGHGTI